MHDIPPEMIFADDAPVGSRSNVKTGQRLRHIFGRPFRALASGYLSQGVALGSGWAAPMGLN